MSSPLRIVLIAVVAGCILAGGCDRTPAPPPGGGSAGAGEVVLYTSVDEPYARPLVEQFTKETGVRVTLLTDTEASKSVGLAAKLEAEKDRPHADVWWSNECFLTIRLADAGVLAAYDSPSAADIPARYKDPEHRWAGSILRVRMLVSSRPKAGGGQGPWSPPARLDDLLRPDLKGRIALARPTAGTTGGHVAALYVARGKEKAERFFRGLHENGATLVGGNAMVAESVARGDLRAGACDNDDAADAAANVGPLDAVLPDQGEGEGGTLAIPCTAALVAGAPHPDAARRLIDFILARQTDRQLVAAKFAWCSTRDAAGKGRFMDVDYRAVAREMPAAIRSATAILEGRD